MHLRVKCRRSKPLLQGRWLALRTDKCKIVFLLLQGGELMIACAQVLENKSCYRADSLLPLASVEGLKVTIPPCSTKFQNNTAALGVPR